MKLSREQRALRIISGEARGATPSIARAGLQLIEPFYATAMRLRNWSYDCGLKRARDLPAPTLSVGNITTGGTGKTPIVRWLAMKLTERNFHPAILLRGYRGESQGSDEQRMLADALKDRAIVVASPDRVAGADEAMTHENKPDIFILDDGFQHRRAKRDFDLVLIDASNPFGHEHVLPRGLLREPLGGLRRADAIVITRADSVAPRRLEEIKSRIRLHSPAAPIFLAEHIHAGLRGIDDASTGSPAHSVDELFRRPFFAFAAIGNPQSLRRQLDRFSPMLKGFRAFEDHHVYSADELMSIEHEARVAGAELLITTEKDAIKLTGTSAQTSLPILRLELQITFRDNGGERLLQTILPRLQR